MVKELEAGDIVFFRPLPAQSEQANSIPLINHNLNTKADTIAEIQTDTILPVADTLQLDNTLEEIPPSDSTVFKKTASVPDDIFCPLPLLEEFKLLETDCIKTEHFESEARDDDFLPAPIPDLDKSYFSPEPVQNNGKSDSEPKSEPDSREDEYVRRFLNDEPLSDPKNDSISVMGWVGIIFLLLIPAVNVLLIIIWALGGCRKKQKARFARALLVSILIIALLIFISLALLKEYINIAISNLFSVAGTPSELALKLLEGILDTAKSWGLDPLSFFPPM